MEVCASCGGVGTVVLHESGTVCTACGVAEALPTLEEDVFGGRTDMPFKNYEETAQTVKGAQRGNKDRVVQVYVLTLQSCLLAHIDVLVARGVDPILESVARQIWIRTLHVSRCLEPGTMHEAGKLLGPLLSTHAKPETVEAREKELLADDRLYNHIASFTSFLYNFLDRETIIWVLYAALVWMQEVVTPLDLALWMERGVLPYLRLQEFQEKAETRFKVYLPAAVFEVRRPPTPLDIEVGAARLAEDIALQLPPINVPLYIVRWTTLLKLPDEILREAIGLYEYHWCGSGYDQETSRRLYYPQLLPVCCILAAMKLSYGLDDADEVDTEGPSWMKWAQEMWKRHVLPTEKFHPEAKRLLKMTGSEILDFVDYSATTVFSARKLRKSLAGVEKSLEKLVKRSRVEDPKMDVPKKRLCRTKGPRFQLGEQSVYTSPLYSYPCRMYWFLGAGSFALTGHDWMYPIDFTAVFAVFARLSNVRPAHLVACLDSLERNMRLAEVDCLLWKWGKEPRKTRLHPRSPSVEFTIIYHALTEAGYTESQAQEICLKEWKQVCQLAKQKITNGSPSKQLTPEMHIMYLYHRLQNAESLFGFELEVPRAEMERSEFVSDQFEWTENAGTLMKQAELACQLNQPFATCLSKHYRGQSLHHSQVQGWDDVGQEEGYESDVEVSDEDASSHAMPSFHMSSNVDLPSKTPVL